MEVTIKRIYLKGCTIGDLTVNDKGKVMFTCKTLELPWLNNMRKVSCIPEGKYTVVERTSEKYGRHFHITSVPNRSFILIHAGNFTKEILGCVLVGKKHTDINKDGITDVTDSRDTMADLLRILPEKFVINITS